jgi:hypothetical protein
VWGVSPVYNARVAYVLSSYCLCTEPASHVYGSDYLYTGRIACERGVKIVADKLLWAANHSSTALY